jgi:hypothetical protein
MLVPSLKARVYIMDSETLTVFAKSHVIQAQGFTAPEATGGGMAPDRQVRTDK